MVSSLKGIWLDNVLQYLSWPQSALVNSAKPPFPKKIVIAKGACCLLHLLECEYRWSTMPFLGLDWLIFEFPVLHRFVNPWEAGEVDVQTEKNNIWWLPLEKKEEEEETTREKPTRVCLILGLASSALVPCGNQPERHNHSSYSSFESKNFSLFNKKIAATDCIITWNWRLDREAA